MLSIFVTKKKLIETKAMLLNDFFIISEQIQTDLREIKKEIRKNNDKIQVIMELASKIESYIGGITVKKADVKKESKERRENPAKKVYLKKESDSFTYDKYNTIKVTKYNTFLALRDYNKRYPNSGGVESSSIVNAYISDGVKDDVVKVRNRVCTHLHLLKKEGKIIEVGDSLYRKKYKDA